MTSHEQEEYFVSLSVPPDEMDLLWAEGWRHFGWFFFRYRTAWHGRRRFSVQPLRVDLKRFALSRSQKRILQKNRDVEVIIRPSFLDREKELLFERHRQRFVENVPPSLSTFLSPMPATVPCPNHEVAVYAGGELAGVTFLDLGRTATSAVYAMFDPELEKRSLGIFMMLESIRYSRESGRSYYYQGYAYREPFRYDYKKRLSGLEYLQWGTGWVPYPKESEP